jgi:hypothetical protein
MIKKRRARSTNAATLEGTVIEWTATEISPRAGNRLGGATGTVRLDDGRIVPARWSGKAALDPRWRPAVGGRVTVERDAQGLCRVTAVERAEATPRAATAPPRRVPPAPLPESLRRAVAAAIARGESPWTIADRFGIDVSRVRA